MDGILYRIEQSLDDLSSTNKKIALYLLKDSNSAVWLTAKKLAETIGVSQAAITRFCKALGVAGFNELKIMLTKDISLQNEFSFKDFGSEEFKKNPGANLALQVTSSIQDTCAILNQAQVMRAAELIYKARHILCAGIGASHLVAEDMTQKLLRVQKSVFSFSDIDLRKVAIASYDKNDLLIAISYSGKKKEILELAAIAHKQRVPIIAFTRVGETPLSQLATVTMEVASYEHEYRIGALSSRISQLYLVDVLFYTFGLFFQAEAMDRARKTYEIIYPSHSTEDTPETEAEPKKDVCYD